MSLGLKRLEYLVPRYFFLPLFLLISSHWHCKLIYKILFQIPKGSFLVILFGVSRYLSLPPFFSSFSNLTMGTELVLGIARKGCWRCNMGQRHPLWMGNAIISPSELERRETDIRHPRWDGRPGTLMRDALPSRWKQPRGSRKLSEGSWYF